MQDQRQLIGGSQLSDQPAGQLMSQHHSPSQHNNSIHSQHSNSNKYTTTHYSHNHSRNQDHYLHLQPPSQNLVHKRSSHHHNSDLHHHLHLHHQHNQNQHSHQQQHQQHHQHHNQNHHHNHHHHLSQQQRNSTRLKHIANYAAQQVAAGARLIGGSQLGEQSMDIPSPAVQQQQQNTDAQQPNYHDANYQAQLAHGHVTRQPYANQALGAGYFPSHTLQLQQQQHSHHQLQQLQLQQKQQQQLIGRSDSLRSTSPSQVVRPRVGSVSSKSRPSPALSSSPNFVITRSTSFSASRSYSAIDSHMQPSSESPDLQLLPLAQVTKSQSPLSYPQSVSSSSSGGGGSQVMSPSDALALGTINLEQYISKRNERERSRVRNVNDAFDNLKNSLPLKAERQSKRLSKVEILRTAIGYIRNMENILGYKQQQQSHSSLEASEQQSPDSVASSSSMSDLSSILLGNTNQTSSSSNSTAPTSTSVSPTLGGGSSSWAPYYQSTGGQILRANGQRHHHQQVNQQHDDGNNSGQYQQMTSTQFAEHDQQQGANQSNVWDSNQQKLNHFNYQDLMRNLEYERNQQEFEGRY